MVWYFYFAIRVSGFVSFFVHDVRQLALQNWRVVGVVGRLKSEMVHIYWCLPANKKNMWQVASYAVWNQCDTTVSHDTTKRRKKTLRDLADLAATFRSVFRMVIVVFGKRQ